jgi:hypothetical protein
VHSGDLGFEIKKWASLVGFGCGFAGHVERWVLFYPCPEQIGRYGVAKRRYFNIIKLVQESPVGIVFLNRGTGQICSVQPFFAHFTFGNR